jgi:hypothetical protein
MSTMHHVFTVSNDVEKYVAAIEVLHTPESHVANTYKGFGGDDPYILKHDSSSDQVTIFMPMSVYSR